MTLTTYGDYARLIFFLLADRATVASHTLAVYTVNRTVGITRGQVVFRSGLELRVFEQIGFVAHHVSPDIKHHRIPAPEMSFTRPNLPFLIAEVERIIVAP